MHSFSFYVSKRQARAASFTPDESAGAMLAEAVAAINRTIVFRLERNLRFLSAFRADHREHLALFAVVTAAATLVAAITAASRLVLEALLRVKLLLACAEDEIFAAVLAL